MSGREPDVSSSDLMRRGKKLQTYLPAISLVGVPLLIFEQRPHSYFSHHVLYVYRSELYGADVVVCFSLSHRPGSYEGRPKLIPCIGCIGGMNPL